MFSQGRIDAIIPDCRRGKSYYGKRSIIFNKNDWCTNKKNIERTKKSCWRNY